MIGQDECQIPTEKMQCKYTLTSGNALLEVTSLFEVFLGHAELAHGNHFHGSGDLFDVLHSATFNYDARLLVNLSQRLAWGKVCVLCVCKRSVLMTS